MARSELFPVYCKKCKDYLCDLPAGADARCPNCGVINEAVKEEQ